MEQLILPVLTYDPAEQANHPGNGVVIIEHQANVAGSHVRCLLTSAGQFAGDCPNVYIERLPNGWNVVLHDGLGDPVFEIEIRGSRCKVMDVGGEVLGEASL